MTERRSHDGATSARSQRQEAQWGETWDDAPDGATRASASAFGKDLGRARKPLSPGRRRTAMLLAAATLGAGILVAGQALEPFVGGFNPLQLGGPSDYDGEGEGTVSVTIPEGATGGQIGRILEENDVVASAAGFASLVGLEPRAQSLQPGVYEMRRRMSAASALELMLKPETLKVDRVTVREGLWVKEVFAKLAEGTGTPVEDYRKVKPSSLPLPKGAENRLEGYLYPSTYSFSPDATAAEQLTMMVETGNDVRRRLGVKDKDVKRVMTVASIAQAEGSTSNFNQVASVIENRLDGRMADGSRKLGMDSTVHFILQERGNAQTSQDARDSDSPYNTYKVNGLPPGPINSPGEDAIDAALHPAKTDYLFFVTVNPTTGETRFARTYEEHRKNEAEFNQWCRDHADQCR